MSSATKWIFWGFVGIAAFFLIVEHRAHLYGYLPFIFLALCPLMHLFHGHGHHGEKGSKDKDTAASDHHNH